MSYKCRHCTKSFLTKERLYEHLKKWHKHLSKATQRTLLRKERSE